MKAYTDIEQSKMLAEILPAESADMCFNDNEPCWSLAALIELMGECRMERTPLDQSGEFTHSFVDDYFNIRTYEEYDIVDAAVEMITKLKEKDLL